VFAFAPRRTCENRRLNVEHVMDFPMGLKRLMNHVALATLLACSASIFAHAVEPAADAAAPAESATTDADTDTKPTAAESTAAEVAVTEAPATEKAVPEEGASAEAVAETPDNALAPTASSVTEPAAETASAVETAAPTDVPPVSPPKPVACEAGSESCLASCKRFRVGDARLYACENFCRTRSADRTACPVQSNASLAEPIVKALPVIAPLVRKSDTVRALEQNRKMLVATRAGNLKAIRRMIEVDGLHPTYVYAYDYNAETRQYDGRIARLRLRDVFDDINTLRGDDAGLDRILALFIELGMDVTARLVSAAAPAGRTAWGPNLKMMETARDRDARMRAFELALKNGLVPNDDFSEWLFAELPQICGRDKSKFAIEVVDLLIRYLGPSVKDNLWRSGARGPETVSDVLDLSFAPPQAKYEYQKKLFAQQDLEWENCALLSRRINRFLTAGN
jgi:hypothetical protein